MFRPRRGADPQTADGPSVESAPELDPEARHDERLILAAQGGDLPSFNALVVRHERAVYNLCLRMLRDVSAAEDATQETFLKAWTAIATFRGGLVRPWLLRIATNRCYDVLRARGRRPADSLDAEAFESEPAWTSQTGGEHPEVYAARAELSVHLERALAALPEDQRLVVILSDVHGQPYEEIAEITGVAVGTVKSRLSRARARLREVLRDDPATREHFARFARFSED
ncbi:MAG TPA: sigma-70 family RNA polymerase sigma factor [Thermomicrobiales bacterium]|nr:sigma-70 family RNA polymerase sigma factor [Thermomicrobiales bacterium]